jgi:uncharacterized C2H2 Zn-finger protein
MATVNDVTDMKESSMNCTCDSDGIHCPHCGRVIVVSKFTNHLNRCHKASVGKGKE